MKVLETRTGETLHVADVCERRRKQIAEERVSERSVWENIWQSWKDSNRRVTLILGLRFHEITLHIL